MTRTLNEALDGALAQYVHGSRLVVLADYDGTLAEYANRPTHARMPAPTRAVLTTLAVQPRVAVGIISGRELDDLKCMVGIPGLFYAGTSGLEYDLRGETTMHPLLPHSIGILSRAERALQILLRDFPGAWLEHKQFGLTIHYRDLDARFVSDLHERLGWELAKWGDRLHVITGAKAVDVTPNLGWTKGTAVEFFLQRAGPKPRELIYLGDESCDLEALWEVGIHDGITIGVGRNSPTTAQYGLPDADAVEKLLEHLCEAVGRSG
jgi:trehalose-phosphatase